MTDTRRRIESAVRASPGIHFNGLVRRLDLATGQVQYHLKRLLADEAIESTEIYGRTHYFPEGLSQTDRRTIALLRRDTTRAIVAELFDRGRARPDEVAEALGVARSTLEWHLERLVAQDLVTKHRGDGNRVTLELVDPEETIELLQVTDPSLLESMVSGYTRLVDEFLGDPDR